MYKYKQNKELGIFQKPAWEIWPGQAFGVDFTHEPLAYYFAFIPFKNKQSGPEGSRG